MIVFLGLMLAAVDGMSGIPATPPAVQAPLPHPPVQADPKPAPRSTTPPKFLNKYEVFNLDNYPYWAKSQDEEGTVSISVEVSPAGTVTSCRVTRSSGSANLDLGTCDLITERARFAPARDAKGRAIAASHVTSVTWKLEQRELWKVEDSEARIIYSVGPNMVVSNCRVELEPANPDFDPRTCSQLRPIAQMMVMTSPEQFDWDDWEVVLETAAFAGAGDTPMAVGKRKGDVLFDRDITRMTINPAGRISRCETIEHGKNPFVDKAAWCAKSMEVSYFVPASDQAERLLTSVMAIYLRKKW